MKAIYWKDLKAEDRRLWLAKHNPSELGGVWLFNCVMIGIIIFWMFSNLSISQSITLKYISRETLAGNQTAIDNLNSDINDYAEIVSGSGETLIYILLIGFVLVLAVDVQRMLFDKYDKFYKMHFKYAQKEIKFSQWIKDKIDGEII